MVTLILVPFFKNLFQALFGEIMMFFCCLVWALQSHENCRFVHCTARFHVCFSLSFSSACCLGTGFLVVSTNGQRPGDPGDSTLPPHHRWSPEPWTGWEGSERDPRSAGPPGQMHHWGIGSPSTPPIYSSTHTPILSPTHSFTYSPSIHPSTLLTLTKYLLCAGYCSRHQCIQWWAKEGLFLCLFGRGKNH